MNFVQKRKQRYVHVASPPLYMIKTGRIYAEKAIFGGRLEGGPRTYGLLDVIDSLELEELETATWFECIITSPHQIWTLFSKNI